MLSQRTVSSRASRSGISTKDRELEKLLLRASRYFERLRSRPAKPAKPLSMASKRTRTKVA